MRIFSRTVVGIALVVAMPALAVPAEAMPWSRTLIAEGLSEGAAKPLVHVRGGARYDRLRQHEARSRRDVLRAAQREDAGLSPPSRTSRNDGALENDT